MGKYQVTAAYGHFGRKAYTENGMKFFEWENPVDLSKFSTMNEAEIQAALEASNYLTKRRLGGVTNTMENSPSIDGWRCAQRWPPAARASFPALRCTRNVAFGLRLKAWRRQKRVELGQGGCARAKIAFACVRLQDPLWDTRPTVFSAYETPTSAPR